MDLQVEKYDENFNKTVFPSNWSSPTKRHALSPSAVPRMISATLDYITLTSSFSSIPTLECFDYPLGRYDSDGIEFDCKWHSDKENCENYEAYVALKQS